MVLSSTPFHHLEHYPVHNVIISQWYGSCTSQEYRDILLDFLHLIESRRIPYAISDRRLLSTLSAEDAHWTTSEYLRLFVRLPLRRFAFINSFDPVAEKQMKHFLSKEEKIFPFEVEFFEDLTSAYDWLTAGEA